MKQFKLLLWVLLLSGFSALQAQTVTGTVTDEGGEPLIGATILVNGTTTGTVTDFDGNFSLVVPANAETATISYTGFASQTISLNSGQTRFAIVMLTDAIGLEDVVVIGYSPVKRKDLTGSVSSIAGGDIIRESGATVQSALRQAPGVVVQQSSGAPGAGFNIRVRGSTSITASNEPLYVVDGVPVLAGSFAQQGVGGQGTNALADINPADIESMEILKDASTTAIYGSRAANGVVLITTKSGKAGKTKVDFNATYGFNEQPKFLDIVDNVGYTDYIEELFGTRNLGAINAALDSNVYSDWQNLIFDRNPIATQNLSISGGDAKTKFFTSLSHEDNQGTINGSRFRRYSARLNLDHTVSDKFKTGVNFSYTNSNNKRIQNDNNIFGALSTAILLPPVVPVRTATGAYGSAFGLENPVAASTEYQNRALSDRVIGNATATFFPINNIALTAKLGVDNLAFREQIFEPSVLQSSANGSIVESTTNVLRLVNEYTASYNNNFGKTQMNAVVGAIFQRDDIRRNFFETNDLPTNNFPSASAAATPSIVSGSLSGDVLHSYISSVNFSFGSGLNLTGSFRADGSSRFVNDRWGYFPGVAASYDLASTIAPKLNQLKVRASWGQTGNNNIGNFTTRQLYGGTAAYLSSPGISPTQIGNPDLVWETTTQFDIGLDIAFLDNKVGLTLDFYNKATSDLILNRPVPTTSGFTVVPENIGDMDNTGFEASLRLAPVTTKNFSWNVTLFGATNRNEVVQLFNEQPIDQGFATRIAEGQPLGSFFGYQTDGIFQNQEEIEAANALNPDRAYQLNVRPGDIRFVDQNGDGFINDMDRTFIGNALPTFTGGVDNKLSWKGLELDVFFQFNFGNQIYNNNLSFAEGVNSVFAPTVRAFENAWRQEGDGNTFPRITGGASASNNRLVSDRFVENGDFVRLKTAQLSYTLPASMLQGVGIRSLRVFVGGTNLITWTNYSWYDPEVNTFGDANAALGTDFLTFPQPRTVQFGINLGL